MTYERHEQPAASPEVELTCQQLTELIVDYLTGEMEPAKRASFEGHLRDCPDCEAFLHTYKRTIRVTRTLRYEDVPAEMLTRVQRFLHTQITKTSDPH
jgi:anti-sigma factor RsiW